MKEVVFHAPVLVGEVVSFYTALVRIGNTSITVKVNVEVSRKKKSIPVTEAELTFVCVNSNGQPIPVK